MLSGSLPVFDAAWEAQRQSDTSGRLAKTLGCYFAEVWMTARLGDPLVSFVISDDFICMEFARSCFIEFALADCPFMSFTCRNPESAWREALAETEGNEMLAIASMLATADSNLTEASLHVDTGERAFLGALGLDPAC
jgi:hypothetical protein